MTDDFPNEVRPIETLFRLCRRPRIILDCGAGSGFFAIHARVFFPGAKIYSFEPVRKNFAALCHNSKTLEFVPLQLCLSDSESNATLYLTEHQESHSLLKPLPPENNPLANELRVVGSEAVSCVTLDGWTSRAQIPPQDIDILKLDVQGAELKVLRGAERLLQAHPIVLLEVSYRPFYEDQPLSKEVDDFMQSRGYRKEREFPSNMPELWGDAVYVYGLAGG